MVVVAETPPRVITVSELNTEFIVTSKLRDEYGATGD
jgi:hypothetical protein